MRELKFRAWWKDEKRFLDGDEWYMTCSGAKYLHYSVMAYKDDNFIIEQFTGLIDKNGKEIYENCELDGRYIVEYIAPSFVGRDIVSGDIIELYDNKFTITKEHSEISQNPKGGIN